MCRLHLLLLSVSVFCCAYGDRYLTDDEEDINYYLGKLYDPNEEYVDPHNMLPSLGEKKAPMKATKPATMHSASAKKTSEGEPIFGRYLTLTFRLRTVNPFNAKPIFGVKKSLFRQNTYLQNKKHTLTCQGGTGCYRLNYQPGS